VITRDEPVSINEGRETASLSVANTGDRPIQVGSHLHFVEANAALRFDRRASIGMRLDIPAGTAVRFEPGETSSVDLVAIGGNRRIHGMNGLTNGSVEDVDRIMRRAKAAGFVGDDP
jgi:urease subunit beta